MENRIKYKVEDYRFLDEFYKQKIRQIHIVGEYANMMTKDYQQALQFVNDYFQMDYQKFIHKYFAGEREKEIELNMTPAKYHQLFDGLSESQRKIIEDNTSKYIVVSAAPGSGKTKVLTSRIAYLVQNGVKPREIREVVYQAMPYVGFNYVIDLLPIMNEVFENNDIKLPLDAQATTTQEDRKEKGRQYMEDVFGKGAVENMYQTCPKGQEHIIDFQ